MKSIEQLIKPQKLVNSTDYPLANISNFDESNPIRREDVSIVLDKFCRQSIIRDEAEKKGISDKFFMSIYNSFRMRCLDVQKLKPELKVIFSDIVRHNHSVDLLFLYFFSHAQSLYPHLESLDDMKLISDLTQPHTWYTEARSIHRKIVFHAGKQPFQLHIISEFRPDEQWKDLCGSSTFHGCKDGCLLRTAAIAGC